MKRFKKFLTCLLVLTMMVSAMPVSAGAALEDWTPGEDGVYSVTGDTQFAEMVTMINSSTSGAELKFKLNSRASAGGGTNYTYELTETAFTIPADVTVSIDLNYCNIKYSQYATAKDSPIFTNNGTLTLYSSTKTSSSSPNNYIEATTAVNNAGTLAVTDIAVKGAVKNSGELTVSTTQNYTTILSLENSGTVTGNGCSFDSSITSTAGTITLTDGSGLSSGERKINLSGDATLNITNSQDRIYMVQNITLADTSKMTISGSPQFHSLVDGSNISCAEGATLTITSGEFGFNPSPYIPASGYVITRSNNFAYAQNPYKVTAIAEDAVAPELTVTLDDYATSNNEVWVNVSTETEGAQVYYSVDETAPIDNQKEPKPSYSKYIPNKVTLHAIAVKDGCPVAEKSVEVNQPEYVYTAPVPVISPEDNQTYTGSVPVTITPPLDWTGPTQTVEIYYTTDGTTPGYTTGTTDPTQPTQSDGTIVGTLYTGPFTLTSSATVMAVAILNGQDQSDIASRQYTVVPATDNGGDTGNGGNGGSSGGGGGSYTPPSDTDSNTDKETVKNPDGSTTTTETDKKTGTVTETTKEKDGTTTIVETKKDGTVTETVKTPSGTTGTVVTDKHGNVTEVETSVSSKDANSGKTVVLPVEVPVTADAYDAPVVAVSVPKGSSKVNLAIPVDYPTAGTVVVRMNPDGTEEIVKTAILTEDGMVFTADGSVNVKVIDNSKDFADVTANYWAADAVDFVTSRELFNGTSAATFTPDTTMTRQMLMTVLARLDGADTTVSPYEQGMAWAKEQGISDGSNPTGSISREQLAVMLYRYAGSPAADSALTAFPDAGNVSGYAQTALAWAVENGIVGGTTQGTLNPQGRATRAQVATMLQRYVENVAV